MNHDQTFAERFKAFRIARRWTIKRMANVVGLSTAGVWNIETGKTKPQDLTMAKIREALPTLFNDSQQPGRRAGN